MSCAVCPGAVYRQVGRDLFCDWQIVYECVFAPLCPKKVARVAFEKVRNEALAFGEGQVRTALETSDDGAGPETIATGAPVFRQTFLIGGDDQSQACFFARLAEDRSRWGASLALCAGNWGCAATATRSRSSAKAISHLVISAS